MIYDELLGRLRTTAGSKYWVVVDNRIIKFKDTDEPLSVWVEYDSETKEDSLVLGRVKTIDGLKQTVNDQAALNHIETLVSRTVFGGIEFGNNGYNVYVDNEMQIVFFRTNTINTILTFMRDYRGGGVNISGSSSTLTQQEFNIVQTKLAEELAINYIETAYKYIWNRVSHSGVFNSARYKLLLYQNTFVPVEINHSELINPLIHFPFIFERYKETDFYSVKNKIAEVVSVKGVQVSLLTSREISLAFHLKRYVPFTAQLCYDLILSNYLANTSFDVFGQQVYILKENVAVAPGQPKMVKVHELRNDRIVNPAYVDNYIPVDGVYSLVYKNKNLRKHAETITMLLREYYI